MPNGKRNYTRLMTRFEIVSKEARYATRQALDQEMRDEGYCPVGQFERCTEKEEFGTVYSCFGYGVYIGKRKAKTHPIIQPPSEQGSSIIFQRLIDKPGDNTL